MPPGQFGEVRPHCLPMQKKYFNRPSPTLQESRGIGMAETKTDRLTDFPDPTIAPHTSAESTGSVVRHSFCKSGRGLPEASVAARPTPAPLQSPSRSKKSKSATSFRPGPSMIHRPRPCSQKWWPSTGKRPTISRNARPSPDRDQRGALTSRCKSSPPTSIRSTRRGPTRRCQRRSTRGRIV